VTRPLLTYFATLLVFGLLDFLWLGVIAKRWYRDAMGELLAPNPNWFAAAAFYLLYPVGILIFAVVPSDGEWTRAFWWGALFGAFAYGTYNLTNLAVVRGWPVGLTFLDLAWGTCLTAACAVAGALAWRAAGG
jgi:uncharacterized membrane protein